MAFGKQKAEELCEEFERLKNQRSNFDNQCQEIAELYWPNHSRAFQGLLQMTNQAGLGEKRTSKALDSTPLTALNRFSAILDSLLTPRSQTWHFIKPDDPELEKERDAKIFYDELNKRLFRYRYAPLANFASQNQLVYKSLGAWGNGIIFPDILRGHRGEKGIRYRSLHISEVYFRENFQGIVDSCFRWYKQTIRQARQEWGDNLPEKIAKMKDHEEIQFLHAIEPRIGWDPNRRDAKGWAWASYYVILDGKIPMEEGGYRSFPFSISRYEQAPGEVPGRSPAMDSLPATKTLMEQKKTVLKQGHRTVDPILLAHDDGVLSSFSLRPGAINPGGVNKDGRPLIHALPIGRVDIGKDMMDDEKLAIRDAFLETIFQILVETPQMTATEVMERTKEKGILLAPTLGRQYSEYLGPTIEREIDVLDAQGLLPPVPPVVMEAGGLYRLEYDSPMSRTQRAEEASGLMRTLELALNHAERTGDPSALDHFDMDTIVPEIASIHGVPTRWLKSLDKIQAIREGRANQAQQEQAITAAPGAAAMVKSLATARQMQKAG